MYALLLFLSTLLHTSQPPPIPEISIETLQSKVMHADNDTLYIVNFWATWCKPCVAELPFFEKANQEFANQKVKFILISLDLASEKDKLNEFVKNKNMQCDVYLLQAGDPNVWINKIDSSWTGGIPTTIMYKQGKKIFFNERDFSSQKELDNIIQTKIK